MKKLLEIPVNYVSATGWTLLHSLWQGVAILLIISVLRYIFRRNSDVKYWFGIGALALQLLASAITFAMVFEPSISTENLPKTATTAIDFQPTTISAVAQNFQTIELSWFEKLQLFLNENLNLMVNVWLLGIVFLTIRLIGGYFYTQNLKWKSTKFVGEKVEKIFEKLLDKISISKPIYLLESALAKIPMTIGHFESVILLPVGLAMGLSVKELEAILAHELAHIRRNDYLVNILQSLVEILFFFHPAVWYISSKIREEREHCCDDLAMEIVGDKIHLAKALTHVEMFRQRENLAMAFGGNKQTLLSRIQRILGVNRSQSTSYESVLGVTLIVLASIIYVNLDAQTVQPKPIKPLTNIPKPPKKPTKIKGELGNETTYQTSDGMTYMSNGRHIMNIKQGQILVDGKFIKLPPEDSAKVVFHEAEIKKLEEQMKPLQDKMQALGKEMQDYGQMMQKQSQPMQIHGKEMGELGKRIGEIAKKQAKIELELDDFKDGSPQRKQLEKQLAELEKENEVLEKQMEGFDKQMEEADRKMEKMEVPMDSLGKIMEKYEKPMEDLGNEIEKHSEAIEKLMPEEVKKIMGNWKSKKVGFVAPLRLPRPVLAPLPPMRGQLSPTPAIAPLPPNDFLPVTSPPNNNLERKEAGKDEIFSANPLILSGRTFDYDNFYIGTQGMFSVAKNKRSKELEAVPFKVYLRRNGKIIQDFPTESNYQIEISRILAKSKAGDQLLVIPVEKKDWKAKRILNIKASPTRPASEKIVFDYFNKNC